MTNYRDLQLPSGLHDLDRWLGQQQFTHAAVMGPHIPEYYGETSSKKARSTHARQMASWADPLFPVCSPVSFLLFFAPASRRSALQVG